MREGVKKMRKNNEVMLPPIGDWTIISSLPAGFFAAASTFQTVCGFR